MNFRPWVLLFTQILIISPLCGADTDNSETDDNLTTRLVIEDIVCEGNDTTRCDFIIKKFYQQPGDVLDPEKVSDAKFRLSILQQFRSVWVNLRKGSERGKVVVVFNVEEASHIQYGISTNIDYLAVNESTTYMSQGEPVKSISEGKRYSVPVKLSITNYNFFGLGKRLDLSLSRKYVKNEGNSLQNNYYSESESDDRVYEFSLEYFDPHLFSSNKWYFLTALSKAQAYETSKTSFSGDITSICPMCFQMSDSRRTKYKTTDYQIEAEVGWRFGLASYISTKSNYKKAEFETSDSTFILSSNSDNTLIVSPLFNEIEILTNSINYGWNTEDDSTIPTTGSIFTASYFTSSYDTFQTIIDTNNIIQSKKKASSTYSSLSYTKHFNWKNNVFTIGLSGSHNEFNDFYELRTRYTKPGQFGKTKRNLSAWFVGWKRPFSEELNYKYSYLEAGYIVQSDKLIFDFTLSYGIE